MEKKKEKNLQSSGLADLQTSKKAFTLAEVLITLGIIGVVAAMTIPTLVANYQQKSMDTAANVFNRKLGEALKIMNANSTLAGYNSTEDFVKELGKNIKIVKTCDSEHLTDCFTNTINTGADPINTTKLKKSKNLYSTTDYGTETIGVQFANGVTALVAYNKNAKQDPFNNSNGDNAIVAVTSSGTGKDLSIGLSTDALSILYDVSGDKAPNSYGTGKDIRGLNIDIKAGLDFLVIGTNYNPVNCSSPTNEGYEYCDAIDIRLSEEDPDNYWVGAKKACAEQGMRLPEIGSHTETYNNIDEVWEDSCDSNSAENTLCDISNNKTQYGITTSGNFWSATDFGDGESIYIASLGGWVSSGFRSTRNNLLCVEN